MMQVDGTIQVAILFRFRFFADMSRSASVVLTLLKHMLFKTVTVGLIGTIAVRQVQLETHVKNHFQIEV